MCVGERERERGERGGWLYCDVNGIESAREGERGRRRTAQINLPLDFNNRIEEPVDTEIGKCVCVCVSVLFYLYAWREEESGRREELKQEEEKEPHRGDR